MQRVALPALRGLHLLALCVWLGGTVVLGAVGAPSVFRVAKQAGHTQAGMPLYDFAGQATGEAFRRLNYLSLAAGVVLLLSGLGAAALVKGEEPGVRPRTALTVLALGLAAWLTFGLYPQLLEFRAAGQMDRFDALHHAYTRWTQLEVFLLLGVLGLLARHLRLEKG